jgi:hypothetical protein
MSSREHFEVHITVDDTNDVLLYGFVQNFKKINSDLAKLKIPSCFINPHILCARALYGKHPKQLMFTGSIYGEFDYIKKVTLLLADDMKLHGINVLRTKIEGLASTSHIGMYYESHFKINTNVTDDWNTIAKHVIKTGGHLSYNMNDKVPHPIVTFRVYSSIDELKSITYSAIDYITNIMNLNLLSNPRFECVLYDDNIMIDSGWIFNDVPNNLITTLPNEALFA